jgi:hypothetical protein
MIELLRRQASLIQDAPKRPQRNVGGMSRYDRNTSSIIRDPHEFDMAPTLTDLLETGRGEFAANLAIRVGPKPRQLRPRCWQL